MLGTLRARIRNGFGRHTDDLWGAILVVGGILVGLSFVDLAGPLGEAIVSGLTLLFGIWGYGVAPALLGFGTLLLVSRYRDDYRRIVLGFLVTFASSLAMFHLMTGTVSLAESLDLVRDRGGAVGSIIAFPLRRLIGFWGAFVVLLAFTSLGVLLMTRTTVREALRAIPTGFRQGVSQLRNRQQQRRKPVVETRQIEPQRPRLVAVNPHPEPVAKPGPKRTGPQVPATMSATRPGAAPEVKRTAPRRATHSRRWNSSHSVAGSGTARRRSTTPPANWKRHSSSTALMRA